MAWMKSPLVRKSIALSMELVLLTGFSTLLGTLEPKSAHAIPQRLLVADYEPPVNISAPGRREGGGTRGGNCPIAKKPLTALIPANNIGFTVAQNPVLLFYLPAMPPQAKPLPVEFVLRDGNEKEIYATTFMMPRKSGIVSVSVPVSADVPPLEVGKNYHWFLSILCNPLERSPNIFVEGWIRRVPLNATLNNNLKQATLKDRPDIYAEAGIWFDALNTLAALRQSNPKDSAVSSEWAKLLKAVGLEHMATEPLVPISPIPSNNATLSQPSPKN